MTATLGLSSVNRRFHSKFRKYFHRKKHLMRFIKTAAIIKNSGSMTLPLIRGMMELVDMRDLGAVTSV